MLTDYYEDDKRCIDTLDAFFDYVDLRTESVATGSILCPCCQAQVGVSIRGCHLVPGLGKELKQARLSVYHSSGRSVSI